GGQDEPTLQIEPWRGDVCTDRSRGRLQELNDLFRRHVHWQNLVRRSAGKFDSERWADFHKQGGRTIDTWAAKAIKPPNRAHCHYRRNGLAFNCGNDKDAIASI